MTVSIDLEFGIIADLVHAHAQEAPHRLALVQGDDRLDYAELDARMDRIACALQRDGLQAGDAIAICATMSIAYAVVFLGALRAGVVVAPLAPGAGERSLRRMVQDAAARRVFVDAAGAEALGATGGQSGLGRGGVVVARLASARRSAVIVASGCSSCGQ